MILLNRLRFFLHFKQRERFILLVKPKDVNYYLNYNKPKTDKFRRKFSSNKKNLFSFMLKALLEFFDTFSLNDKYFSNTLAEKYENTYFYIRVKDLLNKPIKKTDLYLKLKNDLKLKGIAKHKSTTFSSIEEVHDFINSFKKFLKQYNEISKFTSQGEIGSCLIDKNGSIYKSLYARHRFSAAKILYPCEPFPLIVDGISSSFIRKNYNKKLSYKQNIYLLLLKIQNSL